MSALKDTIIAGTSKLETKYLLLNANNNNNNNNNNKVRGVKTNCLFTEVKERRCGYEQQKKPRHLIINKNKQHKHQHQQHLTATLLNHRNKRQTYFNKINKTKLPKTIQDDELILPKLTGNSMLLAMLLALSISQLSMSTIALPQHQHQQLNHHHQQHQQLKHHRSVNQRSLDSEPVSVPISYYGLMQQQLQVMQQQCPVLATANPSIVGLQQSSVASANQADQNQQNSGTSSDQRPLGGNCPQIRDNMLNVHVICHTHLDTGWVETFEQYYFGYVQTIINSVVKSLYENPRRRFIFVETSFLMRWWRDQDNYTRSRFKKLVLNGQLEFISGGWSMNDEAASHYTAIIDQMTLGHRHLNKMVGVCGGIPKIGWQIDPFGHSREYASLLAQMGFDGLFLGRIDFQDKLYRQNMQTMEFVWKSSPSLGPFKSDLFTSILPNTYSPPEHFCFDAHCTDEQLNRFNIHAKATEFAKMMQQQSEFYATNHTIVTMGMDFNYRDANKWYTNLDLLIDEIQSNPNRYKLNIVYSTPSCYLKSIHKQTAASAWPVKLDDFFPYADAHNSYWTGYYTSRPALKYQIELANNFLQAAKQLSVLANPQVNQDAVVELEPLQETLGILQHHDAVTGTCKQHVNDDYSLMLASAMKKAHHSLVTSVAKIIEHSIRTTLSSSSSNTRLSSQQQLSPIDSFIMKGEHIFCSSLNASHCQISEKLDRFERLLVHAYNPASHSVQHYVQIPVRDGRYLVREAASGNLVSGVQQTAIPQPVLRLTSIESRQDFGVIDPDVSKELFFPALLAPLSLATFLIERVNPSSSSLSASSLASASSLTPRFGTNNGANFGSSIGSSFAAYPPPPLPPPNSNLMRRELLLSASDDIVIGNGRISVILDAQTGLVKALQLADGRRMALRQNLLYYDADGKFRPEKNSGAYIFNPTERGAQRIATNNKVELLVQRGAVLEEVQQVFSPWCSQVIRVYKHSDYVEFQWLVGPIPLQADITGASGSQLSVENGREIISAYETDMKTNGTFFTDSNGRETIRRLRNHRSDYRLLTTEHTASNYYPVTSWIFIRDYNRNLQLSLLPDRPQGGSSIRDGQIELMLHRRLLQDDGLGVDEPLNEPGIDKHGLIVRGKHYLLAGPIDAVIRSTRQLSKHLHLRPIQWFQAPPAGINLLPNSAIQHQLSNLNMNSNLNTLDSLLQQANDQNSKANPVSRFKFTGLRDYLPKMVNLLTLESWDNETVLIRLEHIFEINEDADLSRPVQVSLKMMFRNFKIISAREMTLNGLQDIDVARINRLRFRTATDPYKNYTDELSEFINMDFVSPLLESSQQGEDLLVVELRPMDIRTFLVQIAYN